jgi:hypothetical protein
LKGLAAFVAISVVCACTGRKNEIKMMAKVHRPVDNGLIVRLQVKPCFRISIRIPGSCIARLGLFF